MVSPSPVSGRNNPRRAAQAARVASEEPSAESAAASSRPPQRRPAAAPHDVAPAAEAAASAAQPAGAPTKAAAQGRRPAGKRPAPTAPRRRWPVVLVASVLVVLLAVGLVVGGFSYVRWFAHDDAADIQGTWYLAGTDTPVEITADRICLTEDVSYPYTLNTGDKTIAFSFSNLAGAGWYRFSLDRGQLAIEDGVFSGSDTLGRDIAWLPQALVAQLQGSTLAPAESAGKGLTLLSRTPATGTATASPKDPAADDDQVSSSQDEADADSSTPDAEGEREDAADAFDDAAADKSDDGEGDRDGASAAPDAASAANADDAAEDAQS